MHQLIILLQSVERLVQEEITPALDSFSVSWALWQEGKLKAYSTDNDTSVFREMQADETILLVPGEDVLSLTVTLPKMSRAKLTQAIPFAIEEKLTQEIDQLHFAVSDQSPTLSIGVAVVAKEKMTQWLNQAKQWGIQIDKMRAVPFALPREADEWQVYLHDKAIVRMGDYTGFVSELPNLNALLLFALHEEAAPSLIHWKDYTHHAIDPSPELKPAIARTNHAPSSFIKDLSKAALEDAPVINLLQGAYAIKKVKRMGDHKLWQAAGILAALWVLLLMAYPFGSYLILDSEIKRINDQVALIYKKQFPAATKIVAPKFRLEEKLHAMTSEAGENHVLLLLGYIGLALDKINGIQLKRMTFQNNQLSLTLSASSSDLFSNFSDYLSQQGLKVKQQNVHLAENNVDATLFIE